MPIKEIAKETSIGVLDKLLGPSAEALGQRLAYYVEKKLDESPFWGTLKQEQQQQNMYDMLTTFAHEYNKIDPQNKRDLSVNILAPIIDSMTVYFEEPNYKEMFAKLLASSFDKQNEGQIHPSFVEIIKQLNGLDAKLLNMIKEARVMPYVKIFGEHDDKTTLTPFRPDLFQYSEDPTGADLQVISSLENLHRLNLITIRNDILCFDKDYDYFKGTLHYKGIEISCAQDNYTLIMKKYRVELTNFGRDFVAVCCY